MNLNRCVTFEAGLGLLRVVGSEVDSGKFRYLIKKRKPIKQDASSQKWNQKRLTCLLKQDGQHAEAYLNGRLS